MSDEVSIFNSNEIEVMVNLVPMKSGRSADGEFLRVEPVSDDYTDTAGADGFVTRNATNDQRATVTLVLMAGSPSNDKLSAMRAIGLASGNGADVGPFLAKNNLGTMLVVGEKCWIMKPAPISSSKESGTREWPIRIAHAKINVGT